MSKKPKQSTIDNFNTVIDLIESGVSLIDACKGVMSRTRFYEIIDSDKEKENRYARACEVRHELLFEEILQIADSSGNDMIEDEEGRLKVNHENIQRDRLRVDARKWALSKMNPKKYGNKLDMTTGGEKIKDAPITVQIDGKNIELK
jgi:hypothetical protein